MREVRGSLGPQMQLSKKGCLLVWFGLEKKSPESVYIDSSKKEVELLKLTLISQCLQTLILSDYRLVCWSCLCGGGFFLACEGFGRMFDDSVPACPFFF